MASGTPTYIPSPNWDIPADSDKVVLGRFIMDPKNPESQVPKSRDEPRQPSKIYEGKKTDWQTTLDRMRSGSIGLWAKCLQVIGGELSFSWLKSTVENHRFTTLETKYFLPDDEYLKEALQDLGVQAYFEVNNCWKPIYLITGIKIARGASVNTKNTTTDSGKIEMKVDTSGGGVPVEVGPEVRFEIEENRVISCDGSSDYIFAYQLTKIKPKKKGKDFKNQSFVKGAVFGKEDKGDAAAIKIQDVFEIEDEAGLGFSDTWEQVYQNEF
ncbi:hypothetical protein K4K58_000598 [Colletotrichum sp. SAR11_239]|nr:hypothetical protein K4K58_000598 [Colletotrichum sp. SAR11_239]